MLASNIPSSSSCPQLPADAVRLVAMAPMSVFLLHMKETWIEFLAPLFGPSPGLADAGIEEWASRCVSCPLTNIYLIYLKKLTLIGCCDFTCMKAWPGVLGWGIEGHGLSVNFTTKELCCSFFLSKS